MQNTIQDISFFFLFFFFFFASSSFYVFIIHQYYRVGSGIKLLNLAAKLNALLVLRLGRLCLPIKTPEGYVLFFGGGWGGMQPRQIAILAQDKHNIEIPLAQ